MMRRSLVLLLLLLLCGCAQGRPGDMPGYVVLLTPGYPSTDGRCTGALIDPIHVVTAKHCVPTAIRAVTFAGQEAVVAASMTLEGHDVALLSLKQPLYAESYAIYSPAKAGVLAQVYGNCPYYISIHARTAVYGGMYVVPMQDGTTEQMDSWLVARETGDQGNACGGDSGGVVIQDGHVVGVISEVESTMPILVIGARFFSVPGAWVWQLN